MHETLKDFLSNLLKEHEGDGVISGDLFGSEFDLEFYEDGESGTEFKKALVDNNVIVAHEDNHGGEGEGDDYWSVYSFTKGTEKVYVQFDGWYASYNGSEYNEWFFVVPKEVMVTQYFKE